MLDDSALNASLPLLKKKHEQCVQAMIHLNNKWITFNNKFKNFTIATLFRKKTSDTALYLYHNHRHLYDKATKNLQKKKVTLPFLTMSKHYAVIKDPKFSPHLVIYLRER